MKPFKEETRKTLDRAWGRESYFESYFKCK